MNDSSPARPPPPAAIAASVRAEQMRLILAHTAAGTVLATLFAAIAAHLLIERHLGHLLPVGLIVGWLAAKLLIALARIVHAHLLRVHDKLAWDRWQIWTVRLLAVDGLVWGIGGMSLMSAPSETAVVIAASICGVACVATYGLQISLAATAAYVVPMIVPVSAALLYRGDAAGLLTGIGLLILLSLMLSTATRSDRRTRELFRLRIEADETAAELRDALKLAKVNGEAKDRFLAVVSHELRTPLHGILGLVKLARAELPSAEGVHQYRLELIDEAGRHLQRLVNDLLDISLIEAGRLDLRIEPMDLHRELRLIIDTYRIRGAEAGIGLQAEIDDDVGRYVEGDSDRLVQVLHNLLSNAFKFAPLGSSVRLNVSRCNAPDLVCFSVEDNGPGILPAEREMVFEAFVQGTDATGSRPPGIGLGLAISRQLARAMGGDVTCTSTPGRGTVVVFEARLPWRAEAPPAPAPRPAAYWRHKRLKVAVADDDPVSVMICGSVALSLGYAFEEHEDGRSLLKSVLVDNGRPNVIVMDWDLPGLDGGQATQAIRGYEAAHGLAPVKIIGLSAGAAPKHAAEALAAGMDHFLTKPCSLEVLGEVLQSCAEPLDPQPMRY